MKRALIAALGLLVALGCQSDPPVSPPPVDPPAPPPAPPPPPPPPSSFSYELIDLGVPPGPQATPIAIAEDGTVHVIVGQNDGFATAWRSKAGSATSLGPLPGIPDAASPRGLIAGKLKARTCTEACEEWRGVWLFDGGTVTELPLPRVANELRVRQVLDNGTVLAQASTSGMLWRSGALTELRGLDGYRTTAQVVAVNAAGHVTGESFGVSGDSSRATLWERASAPRALELPAGARTSYATDISEGDGNVIGGFTDASGIGRVVVWRRSAGPPEIMEVPSTDPLIPVATNEMGQVLITSLSQRGYLWDPGTTTEIVISGATPSFRGLGNNGEVFGVQTAAGGLQRAFVWRNGSTYDLGLGAEVLIANARGDLAGFTTSGGLQRAVMWRRTN